MLETVRMGSQAGPILAGLVITIWTVRLSISTMCSWTWMLVSPGFYFLIWIGRLLIRNSLYPLWPSHSNLDAPREEFTFYSLPRAKWNVHKLYLQSLLDLSGTAKKPLMCCLVEDNKPIFCSVFQLPYLFQGSCWFG